MAYDTFVGLRVFGDCRNGMLYSEIANTLKNHFPDKQLNRILVSFLEAWISEQKFAFFRHEAVELVPALYDTLTERQTLVHLINHLLASPVAAMLAEIGEMDVAKSLINLRNTSDSLTGTWQHLDAFERITHKHADSKNGDYIAHTLHAFSHTVSNMGYQSDCEGAVNLALGLRYAGHTLTFKNLWDRTLCAVERVTQPAPARVAIAA